MSTIIIDASQIYEIPILTFRAGKEAPGPTVYFIHGFGGDKRESLALGYALASRGLTCVALDAAMHGERLDPYLERMGAGQGDYVYPVESGLDLFMLLHKIVVQTVADLGRLIDHFAGQEPVRPVPPVGVTGFSMGGFASFYAAATEPRIRAAVPMAGIPSFAARWADVTLEAATYPQWAAQMAAATRETAQHAEYMTTIDPAPRLAAFAPRPLLMISGDLDTDSPKKYSVDLYRSLVPLYGEHPDRLQMRIHDGVAHQLTPAMIDQACDWFVTHLGPA